MFKSFKKMYKTTFEISKMDCPSEEQMIKMKLSDLSNINHLDFDIANRRLTVFHENNYHEIFQRLETLKLGTSLIESVPIENHLEIKKNSSQEKKLLWQVLIINFFFFLLEVTTGYLSNSLGLVGDSLDMLADSIVYGLALFAVGKNDRIKKNITKIAGYFQLLLAVMGFIEVMKRFLGFEKIPDFQFMIIISIFALMGNALCLYLLQKSKSKESHIQASMIFTSNDVMVNLGVIVAGILVYLTQSMFPDLFVGTIIFLIVGKGAFRIIKLAK